MEQKSKIDRFEKIILKKLASGYTQIEISEYLKKNSIEPNHIRSVEHRIRALKERFKSKTTISLIYQLSKTNLI